jgi:hypothetical protein
VRAGDIKNDEQFIIGFSDGSPARFIKIDYVLLCHFIDRRIGIDSDLLTAFAALEAQSLFIGKI